jgi:hypothetical protein
MLSFLLPLGDESKPFCRRRQLRASAAVALGARLVFGSASSRGLCYTEDTDQRN